MMVTPNRRDDDTGQSILNFLKAIKRNCRKIVIEGVAEWSSGHKCSYVVDGLHAFVDDTTEDEAHRDEVIVIQQRVDLLLQPHQLLLFLFHIDMYYRWTTDGLQMDYRWNTD